MLTRDDVIRNLRDHEAELRAGGVAALFLFGSVARAEAGPASDVDLFFDYSDPRFSLIELLQLQDRVATILGRDSDLMTRGSLHPMLRDGIERSAIRVF